MGMLPRSVLDLLQRQYKLETNNYLAYTSRSSWARKLGYVGAAKFFRHESHGEHDHSKMVRNYIEDRGEQVEPQGFGFNEPSIFMGYDQLFTTALLLEQKTTDALTEIYDVAIQENDIMTSKWVGWLIKNQIEEEKTLTTIINQMVQRGGGGNEVSALANFRNDGSAVYDIDVIIKRLAK